MSGVTMVSVSAVKDAGTGERHFRLINNGKANDVQTCPSIKNLAGKIWAKKVEDITSKFVVNFEAQHALLLGFNCLERTMPLNEEEINDLERELRLLTIE